MCEIKCSGCENLIQEKVLVCRNGHLACHKCRLRKRCPVCRHLLLTGSLPFLKLYESTIRKCPYEGRGCREMFESCDLDKHLGECRYNGTRFDLCQMLGLRCNFSMCPLEIPDYVDHLREKHGARLNTISSKCTVDGLDNYPSTANLRRAQYLGFDLTILKVEGGINQGGAVDGWTYFLVVGGCRDQSVEYICIHLGPLDTFALKKYRLVAKIKSFNSEVPSLRIKRVIMDIAGVSQLSLGTLDTLVKRVPNLREHFTDDRHRIHEELKIKKKTVFKYDVASKQKGCECSREGGKPHHFQPGCIGDGFYYDSKYTVHLKL